MLIPNNLSDAFADSIVELCFTCLGSCDPDELACFIGAILKIAEAEVRRATAAQSARLLTPNEN
jgi:hypothetical protein